MSDTDPAPGLESAANSNPFLPPVADEPELMVAELAPTPLRLWPAFVVPILAIMAALIVSGVALALAAIATHNMESLRDPARQADWLVEFGSSSAGLAIMVLPGQLIFGACAMGAAVFSRQKWCDRLGFRVGNLPIWTWLLFLLGTPVVGLLAAQLMSRLASEPSEQMRMLERMFQFDSIGSLMMLLLLISLLPGIFEEVLFRGFMQRRLLTRLPASLSIIITSFFFAAAHMDLMHAVGVLPLGLWLGVIAWRADSIAPAIFGHIGNNGYAIVMSKMMDSHVATAQLAPAASIAIMVSLLAFISSIVVLVVMGGSPSPANVAIEPVAATAYEPGTLDELSDQP